MNSANLMRASKIIWSLGFAFFVFLSWPFWFETIGFLFETLRSIASGDGANSKQHGAALQASGVFLGIFGLCLIAQLVVLAVPFIVTYSRFAIRVYQEREENYVDALKGRLKLAEDLTNANHQSRTLFNEVGQCRAAIQQLTHECAELQTEVRTLRKLAAAQVNHTQNQQSEGDF